VKALCGEGSTQYGVLLMQGKFINDRAVLLAAAENAGMKDAKSVLADESMERDQVIRKPCIVECLNNVCSATAISYHSLDTRLPVRERALVAREW